MDTVDAEPEVMPSDAQTGNIRPVNFAQPRIHFNAGTLFQSPCFWMILGAGVAFLGIYAIQNGKKRLI